MKFNKAMLPMKREFPTMECEECEIEFILIGVGRGVEKSTGEKTLNFWEQQSQTVFCPYCGKKKR